MTPVKHTPEEKLRAKKTLFKLEVFEDFTVDSFFVMADKIQPGLSTMKEEPLGIKTVSQTCEYRMQLYRVSLFPELRKELLDIFKSEQSD